MEYTYCEWDCGMSLCQAKDLNVVFIGKHATLHSQEIDHKTRKWANGTHIHFHVIYTDLNRSMLFENNRIGKELTNLMGTRLPK